MFGCNFFVVFFKTSCLELWNAVGPLQLVNCVIQNCHVREQKSLGEDKQRKISLKMKKAFWSSCPSTSLALHWAWQFFYHVNDFCKELVGSGLNGLNFWSRSNEPNTMQQDVGLTYWGRLNESLKMIFLDLQVGTLGQEPFDFVPSCWDRSNNSPDWGSIAMYMSPCSCLDKGPYPYCYHWWTCKSSCIH